MLKYLIILLDDTSVAYCHCPNPNTKAQLIPIYILKQAITYAMKENLNVQFVWPNYELPIEYIQVIESIDHVNIAPFNLAHNDDVLVYDGIPSQAPQNATIVIRTTFNELLSADLIKLLRAVSRLNIVITDVEKLDEDNYAKYLEGLTDVVKHEYACNHPVQLNLLTDRMQLTQMNNCNAGWESITLATDGKFYICPAFFYNGNSPVGSPEIGIDIKNPQLYRISHAPICRKCDAWQCRRCVWLNQRMTLEVNTPSREQCVMAHLERNASRCLLAKIRELGTFLPDKSISKINYTDPFQLIVNNDKD